MKNDLLGGGNNRWHEVMVLDVDASEVKPGPCVLARAQWALWVMQEGRYERVSPNSEA